MKKRLAGLLLAAALGACGPKHATYVHTNVALGRVVVYRNGVAFYERRATVSGGVLTVSVPRDRVDDFLKSLTVVDALTGKPLPISIPRQQAEDGPYLLMKLQLPSMDKADVVLTYVTESPAWKPSYRVAVKNGGKVMLEGWAIVDNTSGEDWNGVMVGVGSSSALSFKYDLWSVRTVQRATLHTDEQFAVAPPTGVTPFGSHDGQGGEAELAELGDDEIRRPDGHPEAKKAKVADKVSEEDAELAVEATGATTSDYSRGGGSGGAPAPMSPPPAPPARHYRPPPMKKEPPRAAPAQPQLDESKVANGDAKMRALSGQLAHDDKNVVIEAYADGNSSDAARRANDRANIVKNQLIDQGIAPARISIKTHLEPGNRERVRLVAEAAPASDPAQGKDGRPSDADAAPVGESNFASEAPMTVEKGSSAMVSMVRHETDGEVVYLYDAESERGNDRFAFRAVRFRNPTDSTLETGPVTVYGDERFIGEGLTEPIAPKSLAIVPYALDRQIVIDHVDDDQDKLSRLVTLERGILTAEVQHVRHRKLVVTNRLAQPAKVYIRHTVGKGWNLIAAPPRDERVGDSHLFEVDLAPGATQQVEIAETTPIQRTLDLNADLTLDMMKVWIETQTGTPELKAQLEKLLGIHKKLVDLAQAQESLHRRLDDYRERMDELHGQILSLTMVKTGGDLMTHLKDKMKDISDRVQKETIEVVDNEEKIMLARVQFQDTLAELTLPDAAAAGAPVAAAAK